ncbi:MAG: peptidylprolyl isomerase [Sedimentisphaerales bacterium]
MKTIVNMSLVLVILLSSTALAAKQKKQKQPPAEPQKTEAPVNTPAAEPNVPAESNAANVNAESKSSGKAVVTVNGTNITEGQVEEALAPRMAQMASRVPENMLPQYRQQMRKRIIENLVIEELLTQKEKQGNIDANQAELDAQINKQITGQNLTLDEFKSLLKAYGTTFGEYQENMRKRLMFDKLMETQFAEKLPKPTDEQMKAYYNDNIKQFQKPEAIHAEHILIATGKDANDPNKDQALAKAKAEGILKKIKAGGNFEELAKQYSDCPSAKQGGDLGVQPKGNLVPEFEKAAYALKPGQVSDIVQTQFGYHIIKLVDHIDANTVQFAQAKDEIKESMTGKEKEKVVMDYIQKIRAGADIKYADEADKLETEISGVRPAPPSRQPETVQPSDENKPAPKESVESNKE